MTSYDWQLEMENMLAAFNRQTTHSLSIIKLAFMQSGLSFTPDFKKHFMLISTNRINKAYDRFQIDSMFKEQLSTCLNPAVTVPKISKRNATNGIECDRDDREDYTSMGNESSLMTSASGSVIQFDDSIEALSNDDETLVHNDIPMNSVVDPLDETTFAEMTKNKSKVTRLDHKNPNVKGMTTTKRMSVAVKAENSAPKQLRARNLKRCTVCGYTGPQLNRHMRTHTGEKPYRCDRCGKGFTRTKILMKHAATHIADFPFHCKSCFHGFSSMAEVVAHGKRCQKRHYECYLCNVVTFNRNNLKAHMRKHIGSKPFRCEICMKHFGWEHGLKKHLNTIHA